ncbi:MAG: cation:proton antiporter [Candidatus Aenigmarchaeota archaeon]|nr:cation:proton antiporter [Candidatus Aenigmarchaeota archaeon]
MTVIWLEISIVLFAAIFGYLLSRSMRQPISIGLILVGVVIGPSVFSLVDYEDVSILAQIGGIILLFLVGLGSNFREIYTKSAFKVAVAGVVVPAIAGYLVGLSFGLSVAPALFIAAALSATSIGITAAVLKEMGKMSTETAKLIIGAAVIDDILGLFVLSIVSSVTNGIQILSILLTAGKAIVFVGAAMLIGDKILPRVVDLFDYRIIGVHSPKTTFMLSMALAFAYSFIAESIGLSAIVGSFLAGVSLANSRNVKLFYAGTEYMEAIFTSVFFVSLGIIVSLAEAIAVWPLIVALTLAAALSKIIGCGFTARRLGLSSGDAKIVGVGMMPRGEVALIIGLYGITIGAITNSIYSAIVFMSFLTTLATPFILNKMYSKI